MKLAQKSLLHFISDVKGNTFVFLIYSIFVMQLKADVEQIFRENILSNDKRIGLLKFRRH
jgi:hypothetical protein